MISTLLCLAIFLYLLHRYLNRNYNHFENWNIPVWGSKSFYEFIKNVFTKPYSARDLNLQMYKNLKNHALAGYYTAYAPFYNITDLEIIKDIFIRDFHHFTDRFHFELENYSLIKKNLFFSGGNDWRVARRLLTPVYTSGKIKSMDHIVLSCAKDMETWIVNNMESSDEFDMKTFFKRCTLSVIARTAFGIDPDERILNELDRYDAFGLRDKIVYYSVATLLPKFLHKFFYYPVITSTAYQMVVDIIKNEMDNRLRSGKTRQDFLQHIIDIIENPEHKGIDKEVIFSQTVIFLLAGYETSNTVLCFAMYELALHPDIQSQVRDEIRDSLKKVNNVWSYDIIKYLKLLEMVILETLRKYPPVPRLERYCTKDYTLKTSNISIKKGDYLSFSAIGFHYDENFFHNPNDFDPWRFKDDRKPKGFFPFGSGPRDCIGKRFALMSITLNLAYLLHTFEFVATKSTPTTVTYLDSGLLLKVKSPLWVKIEKISK